MTSHVFNNCVLLAALRCCVMFAVTRLVLTNDSELAHQAWSPVRDYCQWETFNASCPAPDHVIIMTSARYGRMAESRCADKNYGSIGCAVDVLNLVDARCSGRPNCRVTVAEIPLQGIQPCPLDLTSYFEASFRCVRVEIPEDPPCSPVRFTKLTSHSGYLSSVSPIQRYASSPAASRPCRWLIEAEAGRRINLTVYDFTKAPSSVAMAIASCQRLAVVRDTDSGRETNICTGQERIRQTHVSDSNRVEITMTSSSIASGMDVYDSGIAYFLIHYQVTGCSRTKFPSFIGASVELSADSETALVQCDVTSHVRWLIRCIDSKWRIDSDVGNCSTPEAESSEGIEDSSHNTWPGVFSGGWASPYGVVLVISVGVLFGLVVGSSLLGFAVCLLKWNRRLDRYKTTGRTTTVSDRLEPMFTDDDEEYNIPGCHVISAETTNAAHKRGCDCGLLWTTHPDRYGLATLYHQADTPLPPVYVSHAETTNAANTVRRLSFVATPDLFVNTMTSSSSSPHPEGTCPDVDNLPNFVVGGRSPTEGQYMRESQLTSQLRKGLLD